VSKGCDLANDKAASWEGMVPGHDTAASGAAGTIAQTAPAHVTPTPQIGPLLAIPVAAAAASEAEWSAAGAAEAVG